ncbi:TIGR03086 family metal-binding protein [Streptomyces sp. KLOTTS4A1]|uniref:TIGR03086 family metal-binding protein n=1 Tax=Streptomyces sp. KLOTTS4A1 TaxID=3390996 RepID=UPI0039F476D8
MSNDISALLEAAGERVAVVLDGIDDGMLDAPTPCSEYDVRGLLNHLLHVTVQFQALAAKRTPDFTATPDYVADEPDWRGLFAKERAQLAAAWAAPGALEGATGLSGLPATTVARMILGDYVVHGWDLARATGRPYEPAPTCSRTSTRLGRARARGAPEGRLRRGRPGTGGRLAPRHPPRADRP